MTILGNYTLHTKLGKGSFANVYRATSNTNGEEYAVKVISIEKLGTDPRLHQNLTSEIEIMRDYNHEGICRLYEHFSTPKHINLVIEFCAGGDLQKFIKKHSRLSNNTTKYFIKQLALGLRFLHQKNIIHRDIKSQNILLSEFSFDAKLKIADFGFAKHLVEASMAHSVCGTPLYMAPEIFDKREYDSKVDLWSMGCVLYEMLVGGPPFRGATPGELFSNIRDNKPLYIPSDVVISPDLSNLLKMLLERDVSKRATLEEFVESCSALSTTDDSSSSSSSSSSPVGLSKKPDTTTTTTSTSTNSTTTATTTATPTYSSPPISISNNVKDLDSGFPTNNNNNNNNNNLSNRRRVQSEDLTLSNRLPVPVAASITNNKPYQSNISSSSSTPPKNNNNIATSSANTSSALAVGGAVWAAFVGSNPLNLTGSWKASSSSTSTNSNSSPLNKTNVQSNSSSSTSTPNKNTSQPPTKQSSSSPYGNQNQASKQALSSQTRSAEYNNNNHYNHYNDKLSQYPSSEDFVMIDRLPNRPWRAVESESVSVRNLNNFKALSPIQEIHEFQSQENCRNASSISANENKSNNSSSSADSDVISSSYLLSNVISHTQCICLLVSAITETADQIVKNAVDIEGTDDDTKYTRICIKGSHLSDIYKKQPIKSIDMYKNALALYMYSMGHLKEVMIKVSALKDSMNQSTVSVSSETINLLSEGLSERFDQLIKRAEMCFVKVNNLNSNEEKLSHEDTIEKSLTGPGIPSPELILYYSAIELAREASVGEVLGNFQNSERQYETARLLIESVMLTSDSNSDKKILEFYATMFSKQRDVCKKSNQPNGSVFT